MSRKAIEAAPAENGVELFEVPSSSWYLDRFSTNSTSSVLLCYTGIAGIKKLRKSLQTYYSCSEILLKNFMGKPTSS